MQFWCSIYSVRLSFFHPFVQSSPLCSSLSLINFPRASLLERPASREYRTDAPTERFNFNPPFFLPAPRRNQMNIFPALVNIFPASGRAEFKWSREIFLCSARGWALSSCFSVYFRRPFGLLIILDSRGRMDTGSINLFQMVELDFDRMMKQLFRGFHCTICISCLCSRKIEVCILKCIDNFATIIWNNYFEISSR